MPPAASAPATLTPANIKNTAPIPSAATIRSGHAKRPQQRRARDKVGDRPFPAPQPIDPKRADQQQENLRDIGKRSGTQRLLQRQMIDRVVKRGQPVVQSVGNEIRAEPQRPYPRTSGRDKRSRPLRASESSGRGTRLLRWNPRAVPRWPRPAERFARDALLDLLNASPTRSGSSGRSRYLRIVRK
jgi:hypothetical protein